MAFILLILILSVIFKILDLDSYNDNQQSIQVKTTTQPVPENVNLKKCLELIENGKNIFITGGAGVGKSTLLKKIMKYKPEIELTSTTGISAYNIGGETIHSFLGVGICNSPIQKVINGIKKNKTLYNKLIHCKILAIDEISMLCYKHFEYMDFVLRSIRNSILPFGGIQVIIVGDFFQLPPVNDDFVFVKNNSLWQSFDFQPIILDKIWRQNNIEFIENLNKIRIGDIDNDLLQFFAPNIKENSSSYDDITHFYSHKNEVNKFNNQQLAKIPTQELIFYSEDYTATWDYNKNEFYIENKLILSPLFDEDDADGKNNFDDDKCAELTKNTLSRHKLILKEGCKVMITKNLTPEIVNGTIGVFKSAKDDNTLLIEVKGKEFEIKKEQFEIRRCREGNSLIRKQYPVLLAYALTIHKSQGLTLESAVIDITRAFTFGQVYVAMSRVVEKENLIILNRFSKNSIMTSPEVIEFYNNLYERNTSVIQPYKV